jgi:hypothetical protein
VFIKKVVSQLVLAAFIDGIMVGKEEKLDRVAVSQQYLRLRFENGDIALLVLFVHRIFRLLAIVV